MSTKKSQNMHKSFHKLILSSQKAHQSYYIDFEDNSCVVTTISAFSLEVTEEEEAENGLKHAQAESLLTFFMFMICVLFMTKHHQINRPVRLSHMNQRAVHIKYTLAHTKCVVLIR